MTCNVVVLSLADAIVEWAVPGVGEITGFADGSEAIVIEWADEGKNTMRVAADGSTGTLSANQRTNGKAMIKLNPGSPYVDILRQVWQNNRTTHGPLNIVNSATGEAHMLECAALETVPKVAMGSEAPEEYEFPFLFLRSVSTPSTASASRIQAGASITL